jgi:HTH-type transcriptional regulator/antitoxin HigA
MISTSSNLPPKTAVIDNAAYNQLLVKFQPKVIESEEEYTQAHQTLLELIRKTERSPEETAILKLIATLIKKFDEKTEAPEAASPQDVLLHLMEENGIRQVDLVGKVGSKGVISEIVHGKRAISKSQAKILAEIFQVSPAVFI